MGCVWERVQTKSKDIFHISHTKNMCYGYSCLNEAFLMSNHNLSFHGEVSFFLFFFLYPSNLEVRYEYILL